MGAAPNSANDIVVDLQNLTVANLTTLIPGHINPAGIAGSPINLGVYQFVGGGCPDDRHSQRAAGRLEPESGTNNGNGTWTVQTSDLSSLTVRTRLLCRGDGAQRHRELDQHRTAARECSRQRTMSRPMRRAHRSSPLSGDDTLTGAGGNDKFVFSQPIGNDTIYNFNVASDKST